METNDLSLSEFLSQVTASLSEEDSEAVFRKINAHTLARLLLKEFQQNRPDLRIRILPDTRVDDDTGSDLLIQVDDFDLRVVIVDSKDGELGINSEQLAEFVKLLEDNPNTVSLVVTWTTDELDSVALTFGQLTQLVADVERTKDALKGASSFKSVIEDVIDTQIRTWEEGPLVEGRGDERSIEIKSIYGDALSRAMADEVERPYRIEERKLAARDYPIEFEHRLVMSVLDEALSERDVRSLVRRLTELRGLSRRD